MAESLTEKLKRLRGLAESIKWFIRAKQGLPLDDEDKFQGLISTEKLPERTNLKRHDIFRHDYLYALAEYGGEEWEICKQWAVSEEQLFISEEQSRVMAFIQAMSRKTEAPLQGPVTQVNIPMSQQQQEQKQEKKGFLHK